jgi:hypothetical protein
MMASRAPRLLNQHAAQYPARDATRPRAPRRHYARLQASQRPAKRRWRSPGPYRGSHGQRSCGVAIQRRFGGGASGHHRGGKEQLLSTRDERPHLCPGAPSSHRTVRGSSISTAEHGRAIGTALVTYMFVHRSCCCSDVRPRTAASAGCASCHASFMQEIGVPAAVLV